MSVCLPECHLTWLNLTISKFANFFATTLVIAETSKTIHALLALKSEFAAEFICTAVFVLEALSLK